MSDDSKELSRVEDILSGEDYLPKKPMSRVEELLMDGAMVPKVDDTDNGKVLKVIDGEWQPGDDVSGDNLPPVSSLDNGKVLKVINGEWNIGDDKSESSFVYIGSSYPFSGSKVALPANINNVLIANYTSSPKVPTFLVSSNNIIFEPKEVSISTGTTPSVHIRWGRMYSTFDSATQEEDIYNDSISYNTQNQTTEASYFKTKAIQTIPPVDVADNGKVMQVGNGGTWQANYLPTYDDVPQVEAADVGKVLKATAVGEYDWGEAPDPLPAVTSVDNGKVLKVVEGAWTAGADEGGSEAVYMTLAEYEALPTADKEDPTKIYFVIDEGTVVSTPKIYYKNVLYNPQIKELPNTVVADAGKALVVNSDGVWDKGDIPRTNSVQVPPVIFDNSKLMKIADMTGFPELEKVFVTSEEYSQLTTSQKQDLSKIYYVSPYKFYPFEDGKIIIRTNAIANETKWYFNGFEVPNGGTYNVPAEMLSHFNAYQASNAYSDETSETNLGYIEFAQNYTLNVIYFQQGLWVGSWIATGTPVWGVVSKNGGNNQQNTYSDPYDVETPILIYYGGKQYTEYTTPSVYRELTQADYDLLPASKNSDGIIYFITDNS